MIIEKAKGFIDTLLNKVSNLTDGQAIVNWARIFLKSLSQPDKQSVQKTEKSKEISSVRKHNF